MVIQLKRLYEANMNWWLVECYDYEMVHGTSTSSKRVQIVLCVKMLFWKFPFRIQSWTSIPKIVVLVLWVQIHWLWVSPITSTNRNKNMVDLAWDKESVSKKNCRYENYLCLYQHHVIVLQLESTSASLSFDFRL